VSLITQLTDEMMFFLMVICHQPYSEIIGEVDANGFVRKQGIPFELVQALMKVFDEKMKALFGKNRKENLRKFVTGIDIAAFEEKWRPKE
jgi:isocitrate dehydrogenase